MKRRQFLQTATAAGTGLLILPSGVLFGRHAPSNRLNIALIGTWGRALAHYDGLANENVVALCDVNEARFAGALERFPRAKTYVDWRRCLEQKDLDAVLCCTPDHHHAHIAIWAMNRGLHVFMEKPIAMSVEECRLVREKYLANRHKLATQAGTHRHANPNLARVRELVRGGAIGELRAAYAWGNRKLRRPGYLPAVGAPPAGLHYDLWLGPSPYHPYNPGYFSSTIPGANCLQWNMYWDFGRGQVGDMGNHTMDIIWSVIDAGSPTAIEATGEPFHPEVTPVELTAHFEHPANAWRPPIRVSWYQGGHLPTRPRPALDLDTIGHGAMFKGTKGLLVADFTTRMLLPVGDDADLTYYRPPSKEDVVPPGPNLQQEWRDACRGSLRTSCNFDYNGLMTEQMALGLVAYQAGGRLEYDGAGGRVTNRREANALLGRAYRAGWALDG